MKVLDYLSSFAGLLIVIVTMVWVFAWAIDRDQQRHELAPSERAEVVARW